MLNTDKLESIYTQIIKGISLIILFIPIFKYDYVVFPFIFPKTILFRVLVEILLVAYISLAVARPKYRPRWSVLLALITGFMGVMVIASIFGADLYHSFWSSIERSEGIVSWLHLLAFLVIIINVFREKKDWLTLFNAAIIAGWIQAVYALGQFFNLPFALQYGGGRIGGALGNASFMATFIVITTYIAVFLLTQYKKIKYKIYYATIILVNLFLLWQTRTRGAIISLFITALLLVSYLLWQQKSKSLRGLLISIWILVIIFTGVVFADSKASWVQSSATLNRIATISSTDITTQNRLIIWRAGYEGFKERPLLGWGWENFSVVFNRHFDPAITRDVGSRPWYDRAHNVIVETATTTGIVGLLLYLSIFVWSVKLLLNKRKKSKFIKNENAIILALLTAYGLQNLFVFDTISSYILIFLILGYIQFSFAPPAKTRRKLITKATIGYLKGLGTPLGLSILMLVVIFFFNLRPVLANYHIVTAVTRYKNDVFLSGQNFVQAFFYSPPNDQEFRFILVQHARDLVAQYGITEGTLPMVNLAIQEMEKSVIAAPESVQNYLILAELLLIAAPIDNTFRDQAEELMNKAQSLAPARYQIYTMLGRLAIDKGNFDGGIDQLKTAIELNDNFAEAHWNLAIAYILNSEFDLARKSLDKAKEKGLRIENLKYQNKLLQAYRDSRDLAATVKFLEQLVIDYPDNEYYQSTYSTLKDLYEQILLKAEELK